MKRLLMLCVALILIGIGCKKETKLSEFVIGNWKSQELNLGTLTLGYFNATINVNNTYVLKFTLSDGSQSVTCPSAGYTINDGKNQITIDQPQFNPQTPVSGTTTFNVLWKAGDNTMTWTPTDATGDNPPPTIVWTKE